jgi:hypothetical protein
MNHSEIVSFLWGVADLIRDDTFKRGKYQDVILPLTVLRRLDCVLAPTKEKVLRRRDELRGRGLQDLAGQLRKASGFAFYNTSRYDFDKLRADARPSWRPTCATTSPASARTCARCRPFSDPPRVPRPCSWRAQPLTRVGVLLRARRAALCTSSRLVLGDS